MPTYDYQCPSCKDSFSAFHKMSESAPPCPNCGGEVKKLLTAPAVLGGGASKEAAAPMHGCGAGSCGCK